jgi:hypothetical protein
LIFGNYEDGRYAWHIELIEKFAEPIAAKGNRMLWNWERPLAPMIREEWNAAVSRMKDIE